MNNLTQMSCMDFTAALAAKSPAPGGGGGAALAGALGVALAGMVGSYTVGKEQYAAVEGDVKKLMSEAERLRVKLLSLVNADGDAFEPLSKAYSIPGDDPTRDRALEEAAINACQAPIEMVKCCAKAISLLKEMLKKGSTMLISDVGCGALLCKAAMESAAMNVYVNTRILKDRTMARKIERELDAHLQVYLPMADQIARTVTQYLRKKG